MARTLPVTSAQMSSAQHRGKGICPSPHWGGSRAHGAMCFTALEVIYEDPQESDTTTTVGELAR